MSKAGESTFYPVTPYERANGNSGGPKHKTYTCGACGATTNGRVLCDFVRENDKGCISWCMCSCPAEMPSIIIEDIVGRRMLQLPITSEFHSANTWPQELAQLYTEASKAYAAGAYTASSMACRKLLMACACQEGDEDGKNFLQYVDYITDKVLTFPRAKDSIDAIRTIGNDANHHVEFVNQADAKRAMQIVTYMLNTIYSLPAA